uniref:WD_REPEATS_REGION domain-containing protein n=1 Tax=Macrostomum lignano TaxID=282301 RepID=A0A1I8FCP5_9PLAT
MYRRIGRRVKGHSAPVLCLDWATDCAVLRTQSADLVTKLWSVSSLAQVSQEDASDIRFATETCYLSFNHVAAWQPYVGDGPRASSVPPDRTPPTSSALATTTGTSLCTGSRRTRNCVAFTFDDSAVISSGRRAPLIMQWSLMRLRIQSDRERAQQDQRYRF